VWPIPPGFAQHGSVTVVEMSKAAARPLSPGGRSYEQHGRPDAPSAREILGALIPEALRVVGSNVRCVTRELVIPVTAERADVAAVGDATWLFEIKSARDTLRRLSRQADAFARIADRCVLVAASRHVADASALLPAWWGVIEVEDAPAVSLEWRRSALRNPVTDRRTLLLMLRRDETEAALASLDGRSRTGRRRMSLLAELDRRLQDEQIAACVRSALLRRREAAKA
jgi:hypothetical protein